MGLCTPVINFQFLLLPGWECVRVCACIHVCLCVCVYRYRSLLPLYYYPSVIPQIAFELETLCLGALALIKIILGLIKIAHSYVFLLYSMLLEWLSLHEPYPPYLTIINRHCHTQRSPHMIGLYTMAQI